MCERRLFSFQSKLQGSKERCQTQIRGESTSGGNQKVFITLRTLISSRSATPPFHNFCPTQDFMPFKKKTKSFLLFIDYLYHLEIYFQNCIFILNLHRQKSKNYIFVETYFLFENDAKSQVGQKFMGRMEYCIWIV